MFNAFLAVLIPLLLVFGLYHLFTWFNVFHINDRVYWKRIGLIAAISHFLLATGFFVFTWFDHQGVVYTLSGMDYAAFLFQHSTFWQLLAVFDTIAMLGILAVFSLMSPAVGGGTLLLVAIGMTYIVGTAQWYFVGGGIGALLQKVWDGLKTGEEGEEWFQ
jgi:hypothetical protein